MPGLGIGSGNSCAARGSVGHVNEPFSETPAGPLEVGPLASLQLFWLLGCWLSEFWALGFLMMRSAPLQAGRVCVTSQHLKLAGFVAWNS